MALSKKILITGEVVINSEFGLIKTDIKNSVEKHLYIVVTSVTGKKELSINVDFTADGETMFNRSYSFISTLDKNFIQQAYEYLKTLEEFKDAEDC